MLYYFALNRQWTYQQTLAHTPAEIHNEVTRDRKQSGDDPESHASPAEIRRYLRNFRA